MTIRWKPMRWLVVLVALSTVLASCGGSGDESAGTEPEDAPQSLGDFVISTDWYFGPAFAPILLAERNGYFEDEGLNVTVRQGSPGGGNIQRLAQGRVDFLYGALDELPYALAAGVEIESVATFTHKNVNSIVVPEDSPIQGIEDLAGKTIGEPVGGGPNYAMFPDLLRSQAVDPATVETVAAEYQTLAPGLLTGRFDAINVYYTTTPLLETQRPVRFFPYKDYGFDFLGGYGLIVRKELADEQPEAVRAMVAALLRAWAETARDPGATIDAAAESKFRASFLERGPMVEYMRLELENLESEATRAEGIGFSTDAEWASLLEAAEMYGDLQEPLEAGEFYTNEYLPRSPVRP